MSSVATGMPDYDGTEVSARNAGKFVTVRQRTFPFRRHTLCCFSQDREFSSRSDLKWLPAMVLCVRTQQLQLSL